VVIRSVWSPSMMYSVDYFVYLLNLKVPLTSLEFSPDGAAICRNGKRQTAHPGSGEEAMLQSQHVECVHEQVKI
jgi:hypothetical protein